MFREEWSLGSVSAFVGAAVRKLKVHDSSRTVAVGVGEKLPCERPDSTVRQPCGRDFMYGVVTFLVTTSTRGPGVGHKVQST